MKDVHVVTSSVGGGGEGGESAPPTVLICQNPGKIPKNLDKISENPGNNDPQRCLISKNSAQRLQENT